MSPREEALHSLLCIQLPVEWSSVHILHESRAFERTVFRWPVGAGPGQNVEPTGMLTLVALGSSPGLIDVHGGGCSVRAPHTDAQAAVDHVTTWINRSTT